MKATAVKKAKVKEPEAKAPEAKAVVIMRATLGRIVHYKLSVEDAEAIGRRRTTVAGIHLSMEAGRWPLGTQAHIGNPASAGECYPMIVTKVSPDQFGEGLDGVSGQVFLDGNDVLWVTQRTEGADPGQWAWPPRG